MAKLIVFILLIMIVFLLWYLLFKPQFALSSKLNIQALAKRKASSEPEHNIVVATMDETEHKAEQSNFDAVAKLFFDQKIQLKTIENAEQICRSVHRSVVYLQKNNSDVYTIFAIRHIRLWVNQPPF